MDKMLNSETHAGKVTNNTAYYKAEIAQTLAKIRRIAEETDKTQAETAQLRLETRETLDRLKAMYNVA